MQEPTNETLSPLTNSKTTAILPWLGGIAAALLIGFLAAYFWLYTPANQALARASSELSAVQAELSTTQADLETSQTELKAAQSTLDQSSFNQALDAVQMNVTYTRLALATRDLLTARQEFSAAETNFAVLKAQLEDKEVVSALEARIKAIRANITSDSSTALEELRTLSENLERIERK